ncbi:MAG TPA: hypothetical protein VKG26_05565 [Bacteroidia bacterium]|nr:hypothetical protein [Bacteroidia bacterium]
MKNKESIVDTDKPIFKSIPTFPLPLVLTILIMFPCLFLLSISHKIYVISLIIIFCITNYFLLKRVIFFNTKVIVIHILKRKQEEIIFTDIEKIIIQSSSKGTITVTVIKKTDKKHGAFMQQLIYSAKRGFEVYDSLNLRALVKQLSDSGVKVEFSSKEFEKTIKNFLTPAAVVSKIQVDAGKK